LRTPAGTECPFYYADFHRGQNRQECRLIDRNPNGGTWSPDLCVKCSIPRILRSNGCPNLVLEARAQKGLLGMGRRVEIRASCTQSGGPVTEPEVGCGQCHVPPTFPPQA
jgi:hypothetical protein